MSEFNCGWIEINRTSQYFSKLRAIDIFIDGSKAGSVKDGDKKVFEVPPGRHQIFAKIDWCQTAVSTVSIAAGETATLVCGSEITGWRLLLTSIYLFMPDRMIYLKTASDS